MRKTWNSSFHILFPPKNRDHVWRRIRRRFEIDVSDLKKKPILIYNGFLCVLNFTQTHWSRPYKIRDSPIGTFLLPFLCESITCNDFNVKHICIPFNQLTLTLLFCKTKTYLLKHDSCCIFIYGLDKYLPLWKS